MKKLLIGLSIFLFTVNCYAGTITKAHVWSDGEILTAALLNGNEDPVYTTINALDGTNLASDIAITTSGTCNFTGTFKLGGTALTATGTELNYVHNVTSAIQTQLNAKQASSSVLTTYAGINPSTDIQTFLGSANNSTARTNLGLAIGTDIQAYNSNLTAINQALTTTSSPSFTAVTTNVTGNCSGSSGSCTGNAATVTTNANLSGDVSSSGNTTTIGSGKVTSTMLKTATSEVHNNGGPNTNYTVTGGQYCHYPQLKVAGAGQRIQSVSFWYDDSSSPTSYTTNVAIYAQNGSSDCYAIFLYHTSSGEDYWLFFLIDKTTKNIISASGAPDAPAYGNSNDFNKQPHPFPSYNSDTQEIILIEKMQAKAIQQEAKDKGMSVLELVDRDYKIDFSQTYPYTPIHSGKFSPEHSPVMVEHIPDYITVRKLIPQTDKDKSDKVALQAQKKADFETKKANDEQKKQAILKKLNITEEEASLILK